jgi:hypothetical protein
VVFPTSRRDRSGSNLSNTDANTAAAISAQLNISAEGSNNSSNSSNGGNAIPLGKFSSLCYVRLQAVPWASCYVRLQKTSARVIASGCLY